MADEARQLVTALKPKVKDATSLSEFPVVTPKDSTYLSRRDQ